MKREMRIDAFEKREQILQLRSKVQYVDHSSAANSTKEGQIPIAECREVSFRYPRQTADAITDISFCVQEGEFVVLCGQSGCGKTTLLRHLKKNQIPFGMGEGEILYRGRDIETLEDRESAAKIGYVGQHIDEQIVTDKVWHELAFGLESLGMPVAQMQKRTAEIAQYFGIESWYRKPVSTLSGGQKQILNLASVMAMQPELLLLDEPTSQLDPIGSRRFLDNLRHLNEDFGITVILSEQRLEEVIPLADRVLILHEGRLIGNVTAGGCAAVLQDYQKKTGGPLPVAEAMPVAMRVYAACGSTSDPSPPVSIREGQRWLRRKLRGEARDGMVAGLATEQGNARGSTIAGQATKQGNARKSTIAGQATKQGNAKKSTIAGLFTEQKKTSVVLEAKKVCFSYSPEKRILEDFDLRIDRGSFFAIMGGNGCGKTTALKVLMGICKPRRGRVKHTGRMLYLAQNPYSLFTELTVEEELFEGIASAKHAGEKVKEMLDFTELTGLEQQNPMDLSGGQQQRLALGKLLLLEPDILLLDEPTKGLDGAFKSKMAAMLQQLLEQQKTILMVSHDMEFSAMYATHCGLLFDGRIVSAGKTRDFFADNTFYATAAGRMAQGLLEDVILAEDIIARCR